MTITSILVPFFEKEAARTAFMSAAAVAREMNAHVCAAYMRQRPMPTSVVYYPLGGAFPPENDDVYKRAEDDNAAALRELFDELSEAERLAAAPIGKRTDEMGATAEWRDLKGDLPDGFARLAAAFDLVSMARPGGEGEDDGQGRKQRHDAPEGQLATHPLPVHDVVGAQWFHRLWLPVRLHRRPARRMQLAHPKSTTMRI